MKVYALILLRMIYIVIDDIIRFNMVNNDSISVGAILIIVKVLILLLMTV